MKKDINILYRFLFLSWLTVLISCDNGYLLNSIDSSYSGLKFNNQIVENDTFNMYSFMNIYTGSGVGVGDFNNDGLEDLFFGGNRVSSKLYLNKGKLQFEDITETSNVATDTWVSGVSIVDINQDGWQDIYLSVSGQEKLNDTRNLLFVNNGDLTFTERAIEFGLDCDKQIMHSSFFDYDRDGDLDAYLICNPVDYTLSSVNTVREPIVDGSASSTDILLKNENGKFVDVSKESGILYEGYSLGVSTIDINGDGWQDIYVSNDFLTADIMYINNQDGTFNNQIKDFLKHSSFAGMGHDIADMNNDLLPDIFVSDMLPEDHYRQKMIIPSASNDKFELTQSYGYLPQYTRNTLQLNNGNGSFSEIGQMANVDKTDWSWSSLFFDINLNGFKDLVVSNGFLRDVGNLDYITFQRKELASPFGTRSDSQKKRLQAIEKLGAVKIPNYFFANNGDLTFGNHAKIWHDAKPSCSNGMVYSDLDNDGDLDLVFNNINDEVTLLENKSTDAGQNHFIKLQLNDNNLSSGIGAKIELFSGSKSQVAYNNRYRGYASSVSPVIHFGMSSSTTIDSLVVTWADGGIQIVNDLQVDMLHKIHRKVDNYNISEHQTESEKYLQLTKTEIDYLHTEDKYDDFKIQPLLPHKLSEFGPGMAIGDLNSDGLDDIIVSSSFEKSSHYYLQSNEGDFDKKQLPNSVSKEYISALIFDIDGDHDNDIIAIFSGSRQGKKYGYTIYTNNGSGDLSLYEEVILSTSESYGSASACDFDKDGDLDVFIACRNKEGAYPYSGKSVLLENISQTDSISFENISHRLSNSGDLGMVSSSIWSDVNNDGWRDIIFVGEWLPVSILLNKNGDFSEKIEIPNTNGFWNSIVSCDYDMDGDYDFIIGNQGKNSRLKANVNYPLQLFASDFDKNGRVDPILVHYIGEEEYLYSPLDLMIKQMNGMRVRFKKYSDYALKTFRQSFTKEEIENADVYTANNLSSIYLLNDGELNFHFIELPQQCQYSPLNGLANIDVNGDGFLDVIINGNNYETEPGVGRYDAFNGGVLLNDKNGFFDFVNDSESGFMAQGNNRALGYLEGPDRTPIIINSVNEDSLLTFKIKDKSPLFKFDQYSDHAILIFEDGTKMKLENHIGEGYLTQNSKSVFLDSSINFEIVNSKMSDE